MEDIEILKNLNQAQKQAVEHHKGPELVLAGAGSGKTRVLTRRIGYLINHYGVSPYNILAVTFTNKAANEMKERAKEMVGGINSSLWVSTFHSFCVRILRREAEKLGYNKNFVIFDSLDQRKLVKEVLKSKNLDPKKTKPRSVLNKISNAKNELKTPEQMSAISGSFFDQTAADIYEEYQKRLKKNNAMDFDDLIQQTVRLFEEFPLVLEHYQERFKYILVDEYQDVNHAQYQLVNLLAERYRNVCVVGDPDQGIYGFRGADIRNILNFEDDYPDVKTIRLEQNYRSKGNILKAAQAVIKNNSSRKEKELWTDQGEGPKLELYEAKDEKEEADFVCRTAKELTEKEDLTFDDLAVLYRTNSQSRAFEDMLMKYGIPYQIVGGVRFYERMEIKDIMAYLRLIYNPADDISFLRIINRPKRGIGAGTLAKVQDFAETEGLNLYEAALKSKENPALSGTYAKRVLHFTEIIEELRAEQEEIALARLTEKLLDKSGYRHNLEEEKTAEAESRLENIEELFSVINEYMKNSDNNTLAGFLEEVTLMSDIDSMDEEQSSLTLMTIHSAKGLEFPVIFLVGMEDGIFPHSNSMFEQQGMEEERRLCYVGMTRAEERLYLSRAQVRLRFGERKMNPPSQFIEEIPAELLSGAADTRSEMAREEEMIHSDNSGTNYAIGQKIVHPRWGIGTILSIRGDKNPELKIAFEQGKTRNLLAEYAPIQKV
ncbi:DNA helicase-2/ATP-dependent DNA helicase PcrA [Halanaerobium saccharolyticum]|uniref:ATP-dependent DNA helicase n=1 Tax=Halanaerobium saccharolyticum TaxID=43595 RepID=A0A4R7YVL8_9FIRM|nr:DNA helicase PcrA [Halanaerobium saccharolyticum]RAK07117.1 DNA helicase-2/ATP-dependent DNA helicase PcrA [Halanaerobium saccharolyticum]TDW01871.1 DNA helicase-2/ATP-dependent DNA helicase PcrA [Halanaerobium saccharolyticum]TDX53117.1 DNA helicase-2/ATP-dependent DNA helicase PcrA [Halanaerobium saccharolyticum]